MKAKPKQKEIQNNDNKDPMMETDPWAQAIKERKEWKLETNFFKLQDGSSPAMLDKLTHGARGIALISEKEAELLMKQQEHMSDQELAAVIFASNLQGGRFQVRDIQVPCRDADDHRVLVRAQMVNLGAKMVTIMGEDSKITIDEVDGTVLSCEIIRKEMQEWDEATEGVVKLLKRKFNSLEAALFSTWGRKFFAKGKPVPDHRQAESCYVMLRIKREYRDAILRTVVPGIYMAPRNEGGAPDHLFKVVWCTDQNLQEVTILAYAEPKSYGLVRNKTGLGIRVKAEDFMKLKQKWQPGWKPQDGTPYGINIKCHYDIQNLPVSCSKTEVQKFLNTIKWNALAIRQVRPRTWLVGSDSEPPATVHIADHGTILITERLAKANGKGKKAARSYVPTLPWIVAGQTRGRTGSQLPRQPPTMTMDQNVLNEVEEKLQKKMDQFQKEQASANAILKEDILNLKEVVRARQEQQDKVNQGLQQGIQNLNDTLSNQFNQHMAQITAVIQGQKNEFTAELKSSQGSLREELMGDLRQQMATMRKRTPSPSTEEAKKQRQ